MDPTARKELAPSAVLEPVAQRRAIDQPRLSRDISLPACTLPFQLRSLFANFANQPSCSQRELALIGIGVRRDAVSDDIHDVDRVVNRHLLNGHIGTSCVLPKVASRTNRLALGGIVASKPLIDPARDLMLAPGNDVWCDAAVLWKLAAPLQPPDRRSRQTCSLVDSSKSQQLGRRHRRGSHAERWSRRRRTSGNSATRRLRPCGAVDSRYRATHIVLPLAPGASPRHS